MTDTLLTMCQDVTDEIGIERPQTIVSNTSDTARRLLQSAQRTGNELARRWYWSFLTREHTFDTVEDQSAYDLPDDFDRMIPHTQWDRDNEWRLWGPLTPQEWQFVKSGVAEEGPRRDYRIKPDSGTNKVFLSPPPGTGEDGETLVFEYISTNWCVDTNGDGRSKFQADTDKPRFDDELFRLGIRWRILRSLGLEYLTEFDEFDRLQSQRIAGDGDMPRLRMDAHFDRDDILTANVQDANFPSS